MRRVATMAALSTRGPALVACVLLAGAVLGETREDRPPPLRVCADPNNMPFSNARGEGFENHLATMLASDAGTRVAYTWWAQRRGFIRQTLDAGACDVIMGLPRRMESVDTTRPYYRSTYVFVSRRDRHLDLASIDDPRLSGLRIGVQMIGDDGANSPPAHALSTRGIVRNVVGYSVLGDYSRPTPPARIVDAVVAGEIDVALVWGPLAGFLAREIPGTLALTRVTPEVDTPARPFVFDISMAVRRGDAERLARLDRFIHRRRPQIDRLLEQFGVPRVDRDLAPEVR